MPYIRPHELTPEQRATMDRAHRLKVRHYDESVPQSEVCARIVDTNGKTGITQQYYNAILNRRVIGETTAGLLDQAEAIFEQILAERQPVENPV